MEGEMYNFLKVWASVIISLTYCYAIGKFVGKGFGRLLLTLPIVVLFFLLPLGLDSPNLSGLTGFFIAWLGNFKLVLFAFGKGPLVTDEPSRSLPHFVAIACLPIKVRQKLAQEDSERKKHQRSHRSLLNYAAKFVLLATIFRCYDFRDRIHPKVIYLLYCFHIYFSLEITQAALGAAVRAVLGMELELQFNQPHLSTSLQDFWSRCWNLMVPSIMHPSVYEPVRNVTARVTGRKWAPLPAILASFLVLGLMHEVIFYYLVGPARRSASNSTTPALEVTWFFLLHGVCLAAEVVVKKSIVGKWRIPRVLSGALTCGFVIGTGLRWFMPPLLRTGVDKRGLEELGAVMLFVKENCLPYIFHHG